jgi:hypothetical protein
MAIVASVVCVAFIEREKEANRKREKEANRKREKEANRSSPPHPHTLHIDFFWESQVVL